MDLYLAAAVAGVVIGLTLGVLGAGGSILAVPALVYLLGQSPSQATTGSLVVVGVTAASAALSSARRTELRVKPGIGFGMLAVAGAAVGSLAATRVSGDVLLGAFSVVLFLAAAAMTVRRRRAQGGQDDPAPGTALSSRRPIVVIAAATAVGLLTGFLGVGGGFLIVPALVVTLAVPIREAAGTSLVVIAITSGAALVVRAVEGTSNPDWLAVLALTATSVAAALLGSRLARRINTDRVITLFIGLLVAVGIATGIDVALRVG